MLERQIPPVSTKSSIFEERVAMLVHPSVTESETRANHIQYMMSRLLIGALTLASLPIYLSIYGKPSSLEALAFLWLLMPLVSTFVLSATGREDWTIAVSSLALAATTVTFGAMYGGIFSPVVIWFAIIPLEALFLASARTLRFSVVASLSGFTCLALLDGAGYVSHHGMASTAGILPLLMLGVLAHIAAVGSALSRKMELLSYRLSGKAGYEDAIFHAINDTITAHDDTGQVVFASASSLTLLGLDPRALLGKGLFERLHVTDRPTFLKALSDAKRLQRPIRIEMRLTSGFVDDTEQHYGDHARVLWVEMTAQALKTPHANCSVVCTMTDITAHKRYERELEEATLEAEKASDLKGKFLATVSHELRTPLNAIIGFSEILATPEMSGLDDARRLDYAKIIHTSGYHLLEIVNTLLDISKIDTGNFDLNYDTVNPARLLNESCDIIQIKADQGNVKLVREVDEGVQDIIADKRALKQVILNVLSNAVKFTSQGGTVTLKLLPMLGGIKIIVEDTGIGIAKDDLQRIGDPFFQVRSSYDRPYEGTGLGVSVVKGLVGLHHGDFDIESELGKGTKVTITLPMDCRHKPATQTNIIKMVSQHVDVMTQNTEDQSDKVAMEQTEDRLHSAPSRKKRKSGSSQSTGA
jgi:cell cycle sensor histidine kinase DivJ